MKEMDFSFRGVSCDLVDRLLSAGPRRDPRNHTKPHEKNFFKVDERHNTLTRPSFSSPDCYAWGRKVTGLKAPLMGLNGRSLYYYSPA
jgi:hypothetical protein